jgi:hypothetical protein
MMALSDIAEDTLIRLVGVREYALVTLRVVEKFWDLKFFSSILSLDLNQHLVTMGDAGLPNDKTRYSVPEQAEKVLNEQILSHPLIARYLPDHMSDQRALQSRVELEPIDPSIGADQHRHHFLPSSSTNARSGDDAAPLDTLRAVSLTAVAILAEHE